MPKKTVIAEPQELTVSAIVNGDTKKVQVPASAIIYDEGVFASTRDAQIGLGQFHFVRTATLSDDFVPILAGPVPGGAYVFMGLQPNTFSAL